MMDLQQALAEWGAGMGLALAPGAQDAVQLRFPASGALLGVAGHEDAVVVHYADPLEHDGAERLLAALRHAGQVSEPAQAVQVGLRSTPEGDWLVAAVRFPTQELSGARIQQAAEFLRHWLAQARD
ncbi:hypothetical protein C6568_15935 [Melaminivora suipulveris]|uniref:Type III secretion chaperone SycN n=1 Tax=Melaminivora suipulveris TaxID=2109913 RepID=A0A2R3QFK4_9BURK|nr:hypothetical protein [Melaminivora suipulveris]AVO50555.1 hypothetical protein C6568_15935 [Melaminivora suipulveris]